MNKLFSKIATLSVGLAMAIGVGVAVGQSAKEVKAAEYTAYILDGSITTANTSPYTSYNEASLVTQSDIEWSVMAQTAMNPWRIGGKSSNGLNVSTDRCVFSKGVISQNISKVIFTAGAGYSGFAPTSFHLVVSTEEDGGGTVISDLEGTYAANSTTTFERPVEKDWSGKYYKFVFNMINTTNTQKYIHFVSAEFKYEVSVQNPDKVTVSGDANVTIGETANYSALCTKSSVSEGVNQNVVWTSSDEKVATVSSTGVVTGVGNGSATIRATAAEVAVYGEKTISVLGAKTDDSAFVLLPGNCDFGGYAVNGHKTVSGMYIHFNQSGKMNGETGSYIQIKASEGVVDNVGAFPVDIKTIELTLNSASNGNGYVMSVSADGETYTPISADSESNVVYTVSAGYRFFKLQGGTGTLRINEILIGFGNATESKLVTLASTLNVLLDAECKGESDNSPISEATWNATIKAAYVAGDSDAKSALAAVGASGSYKEVNRFLERYDYIVGAYGYDNFLERSVSSGMVNIPTETSTNSTIIIIVAATFAITAFGAILLIRKKKHSK